MTCSRCQHEAVRWRFSRKRYGIFFQGNPSEDVWLVLSVKTALSFVNYFFMSCQRKRSIDIKKKGSECPLNGANLFFSFFECFVECHGGVC